MNTSTTNTPFAPEVLTRRRWKWWRSLWVQSPVLVALMWIITAFAYWWPSQSAWAVFRMNGLAEPSQNSSLYRYRQASGLMGYFSQYMVRDRDVVSVQLLFTAVDDQWLVRLRRFPKLQNLTLDGGQIGPGLRNLADLPELKAISVFGKQRRIIRGWIDFVDSSISGRDFLQVPQLESLSLSGFLGTISDLDQLKQHPNLRSVSLQDVSRLSQVLRQIEHCQNIKSLSIRQTEGVDEEALASVCRMPHLEELVIYGSRKPEEMLRLKESLPTTNVTAGIVIPTINLRVPVVK